MNVIDDIKILTGKKKDPRLEKPAAPPKKILIVEDEKPLADILYTRLTEEGFLVATADNGQKGLELAATFHPNVILLDLLMPVMDGKQMLRALREIPACKTTPVIVLTNAGEIENIRETQFYSNAEEFLIKSNVSMEEIIKKVKFYSNATILK
ncbi:MAG TPA: response regulator [Patescibacteria group bacterium]|nr:response regulator [Patescibacteria group bacterium]